VEFVQTWPAWGLALLIFGLRIVDVSLGTLRTISVVEGRLRLSVALGFFEVLIWITAVSQVIGGIKNNPLLLVAYAAGFAAGNAMGITLERRLAMGTSVVRIISMELGPEVAERLRALGQLVTTFVGEGSRGPRTLIYATCPRREVHRLIDAARAVDPRLFYVVERVSESSSLGALPHGSGWRSPFKKK